MHSPREAAQTPCWAREGHRDTRIPARKTTNVPPVPAASGHSPEKQPVDRSLGAFRVLQSDTFAVTFGQSVDCSPPQRSRAPAAALNV